MAASDPARNRERAAVLNQKRPGGNFTKRNPLTGVRRLDDFDLAIGERVAAGCNGGDRERHVVAIGIDDDRLPGQNRAYHIVLR